MLKKLFKNRSLKRFGLYVLCALFLVLSAEYLIIRAKIERLEEVEEKKDYVRSAQIYSQQIALHLQNFFNGRHDLAAEIISTVEHQDHILETIQNGGRMEGTDVFLDPLSRLPQISFEQLLQAWSQYKANVMIAILEPVETPSRDESGTLSDGAKARTLLPGQWLTLNNWYKNLEIDLTEEAEENKTSVESFVLFFIIFDFALLVALYVVFYRAVINPLEELTLNTQQLIQKADVPPNEVGNLTLALNGVLEQLKDATEFVGAIGDGKLDFDYRVLDAEYAPGANQLADSLIGMQRKLKEMNIGEKRRQWANEGLTKFVDILRSSNDDLSQLGDKIVSALVKYTRSNQGGLYLLNDEDEHNQYLELISKFAFDIKKFDKQKVKLGEGLLGQTFLEKETTLLNQLPDEYIRITSGLGDATPRSILIVPLKVDQHVYGVVELASFEPYLPHEIEFVERLAETIASTLASVKSAQQNRQLIEQFQQQTEEMRAQEEEMRQNMEELQATQEELSRKETDYIRKIESLSKQSELIAPMEEELTKLRQQLQEQVLGYEQKIKELNQKLTENPARVDDWALAEELQSTLRFQLEALRIAAKSAE